MRRFMALSLAVILSAVLCACGSDNGPAQSETTEGAIEIPGIIETIDPETADTDQIRAEYDKAVAYFESIIDLSKAEMIEDDSDPTNLTCVWDFGGTADDMILSTDLELAGNSVVIGETTVKDTERFGLDMTKYTEVSEPGDTISVSYEKAGKSFVLQTVNDTDENIPLDDMSVCGFSAGTSEYMLPYSYEGISSESDIEEALNALGTSLSAVRVIADLVSVSLELSYYGEISNDDSRITANSLELSFSYDTNSSATEMTSMNMIIYSYEIEN